LETIVNELISRLRERGLTLGAVESATGGLISHLVTGAPGCSDVFMGAITSYSNGVKINVVGVKAATLEKHGAVSKQVARQMAAGGRRALGVDVCVADTGIAGPGGATEKKRVGLFYIGLSTPDGTYTRRHMFNGTREENKLSAARTALEWAGEWVRGKG